jgi:hypothetical protein
MTKRLKQLGLAFQLDNEYAPSALMYGILLLDFAEIDEAVTAFAAAVKADDGVAIYHLCLGMALRQQAPPGERPRRIYATCACTHGQAYGCDASV